MDSAICRLTGSTTCSCSVRVVLRVACGAVWAGPEARAGLEIDVARRPRTESPAFPGRDAGERRFGSGRLDSGIRTQRRFLLTVKLFDFISGPAHSAERPDRRRSGLR